MEKLKVCVIIAAYNEEKYLEKCLTTLMTQDYKPMSVIVVDDGSTDQTKEIISRFPVEKIELTHEGTANARNKAAEKTDSDILVFLDADMEFEPDFITRLVEPIVQGGSMGTFSRLEYVKNWDKPLARCWNRNNNPPLPDKLRVPQRSNFGDDFRAILKSEFDRVNGFDNTGYSDTWTLHQKLGYKPVNAPAAVYYHHNPETFGEVFSSAQWIGKRRYKFGLIGSLVALIRSFFLFSIMKGLIRAIIYREPTFLTFQMIYDAGISSGVLRSFFFGEVKK